MIQILTPIFIIVIATVSFFFPEQSTNWKKHEKKRGNVELTQTERQQIIGQEKRKSLIFIIIGVFLLIGPYLF